MYTRKSREQIEKELLSISTMKPKGNNRKKTMLGIAGAILGTAAVVTPIAIYYVNNVKYEVVMHATGDTHDIFTVEIKKNTAINAIKVVDIEGYTFKGFYKDKKTESINLLSVNWLCVIFLHPALQLYLVLSF